MVLLRETGPAKGQGPPLVVLLNELCILLGLALVFLTNCKCGPKMRAVRLACLDGLDTGGRLTTDAIAL